MNMVCLCMTQRSRITWYVVSSNLHCFMLFNITPHKIIGYGSCSVRHESVLFASGVSIGVVFIVFAVSMFAKFMSYVYVPLNFMHDLYELLYACCVTVVYIHIAIASSICLIYCCYCPCPCLLSSMSPAGPSVASDLAVSLPSLVTEIKANQWGPIEH